MTDYCAGCGTALIERESGGRVACCPEAAMYWTPRVPLAEDARGFYRMTGRMVEQQPQWFDDDIWDWRSHAPLTLYRSVSGGMT